MSTYREDMRRAWDRINSFPTQRLETRFGTIEYADQGDGPPLLVSHGVLGCHVDTVGTGWASLPGPGFRVIGPSRFGYFGSTLLAAVPLAREGEEPEAQGGQDTESVLRTSRNRDHELAHRAGPCESQCTGRPCTVGALEYRVPKPRRGRWRIYRAFSEQLESQGWHFLELTGSYQGSHQEALPTFIETVEQAINEYNREYEAEVISVTIPDRSQGSRSTLQG